MPIARVQMPDGRIARIEVDEGTTPEQVEAYVRDQVMKAESFVSGTQAPQQPSEGFGERVNREIQSVPRQLGLLGRSAVEGVGEFAGIFSNPIQYGLERATGRDLMSGGEVGRYVADKMGLPSPESQTERVVSAATKTAIPVGGQAALAARATRAAPGIATRVAEKLAIAPASQISGAVTGGGAAQYAKDTGADPMSQLAIGVVGGFGGAAIPAVAAKSAQWLSGVVNNVVSSLKGTQADIKTISSALNQVLNANGMSIDDISGPVRVELLREMRRAMDTGAEVNPVVLRRIADHAAVGTVPTRGTTTLDPIQITQERNLAKFGANSPNPNMQQLARNQRANDIRLTENLNEMGAARGVEPAVAGARMQSALRDIDVPRKAAVDNAYRAVRDAAGRYADIDVPTFSRMANDSLDSQQLGYFLPAEAKNILNDISSGKIPLNINTLNQFDKVLSGLRRDRFSAGDSQGALAVNQIRKALWDAPVSSQAGNRAKELYDRARRMARERFALIEDNPAMLDALDDVAPDKFVQTYITGSGGKANVRDVASLSRDLRRVPEAFESARSQILMHLKEKALSMGADETANFSPANYNKALKSIGDSKLRLFFNQRELEHLKTIGRVASYEKFQPTGSAVNNSNTAAMALGALERFAGNTFVAKIPILRVFASFAADQARNQANRIEAGQALSPTFTRQIPAPRSYAPAEPLLIPGLMGMGQE